MYIFLIALLSLLPQGNSHNAHPLYVSITDVNYNASEKSLEIISKIYLDDLEEAISKKYNQKIDLFADATDASKKLVLQYMQSCLQFTVDGKNYSYHMVGYERKKDACWVYIEATNVPAVKNITVYNNLLHDYTSKQINLVTVTVGSSSKSHKLSYPDKEKSFSF